MQAQRAVRAAAVVGDAPVVENYDDIDWTEDLPTPVRRRVAALREVQTQQDEVNKAFVRERAELEAKYQKQLGERMRGECDSRAERAGIWGFAAWCCWVCWLRLEGCGGVDGE